MVDVLTKITINKPIEEVASYAANPDNAPEWYVNIKSAVWQTPKPLVDGSKIAFIARFMGKTLSYTYEVKEFTNAQKLVMQTSEGPFPMETTYTWQEDGKEKTLMTLRNAGQPKGFSKLFSPFMVRMMRKANRKDLVNLKRIIESK